MGDRGVSDENRLDSGGLLYLSQRLKAIFQRKISQPVTGNFVVTDENGELVDSGTKPSDFLTPTDIEGKADKVTGAVTPGNFASLDEHGNLTDSGCKASDYVEATEKGAANGIAELDSSGKVPSSQLPAYVDDVIDGYYYDNKFYEDASHTIEITGESGKIYVDLETNKSYRWSGSTFVVIASDLALGETSSTAYRGDRGAAAYAAAVTNVETTPTADSANLITSGAVYSGLADKADKTDTVLNTTLSMGRKDGSTVGGKSTALGENVTASGGDSFAAGYNTTASGTNSHSEGCSTIASGSHSHAEGMGGTYTKSGTSYTSEAKGPADHVEGFLNRTANTAPGNHAEGYQTAALGGSAHSEGTGTTASGNSSHAEGQSTIADGSSSHAEGTGGSYTSGSSTITSGAYGNSDHSEGYQTLANSGNSGSYGAHAEGYRTSSTAYASHAEGKSTVASGQESHAEGDNTSASEHASHAEGCYTIASGPRSHAEGYETIALDGESHAEGYQTNATDEYTHSEGDHTLAHGKGSHTEGYYTTAIGAYEHTGGKYNVLDTAPAWVSGTSYAVGDIVSNTTTYTNRNGTTITKTRIWKCKTANSDTTFTATKWEKTGHYAEQIGNGTADNARSNARTLDWSGNERLMGDIYVGCNGDGTGGTKLQNAVQMTGADGTNAGASGLVPAPAATDNTKFLKGDGTWDDVPDPTGKADKVSGATNGNFAGLDSNGNLTDSGSKASDFIATSQKGAASGVAELDANGKVPTAQLPSYVDDVVEYASQSSFPATGETGKIYVALDTNKTYRWSGSEYVEISPSLALGETSSTAYRGDRGKTAYDHATDANRLTTAQTEGLYKVATTAEGHVKSVSAVAKSDITALGIPAQDTTYSAFTGADGSTAGAAGLVPAPAATDNTKFLKGNGMWATVDALPAVTSSDNGKVLEVDDGAWTVGSKKIDREYQDDDWIEKTWNGFPAFTVLYADYTWTDGENIYYSGGNKQYVLDVATSTWSNKTWNWFDTPYGNNIWTDGTNIYYSSASTQYVLNKSTSTWEDKTWTSLVSEHGAYVWTDGENTYYSNGTTQYVLNKSTSQWETKTWTGLTDFYGNEVWSDGENIYYSDYSNQYVLNTTTSTWSEKTWTGLTPRGLYIWLDAENNVYYSYGTSQYELDKDTSTWTAKTWSALPGFYGDCIWKVGENVYLSNSSGDYQLNTPEDMILLGTNGEFSAVPASTISKVKEYDSESDFPATGTVGIIYVADDANELFRWDATESEYVSVGGGSSGESGVHKIALSIATTDWTSVTGGYKYDVTDSNIDADSEEIVIYDNSLEDLTSNISYTKTAGSHKITFNVASLPTGTISGRILVITSAVAEIGDFTGATSQANGTHGLVPAPTTSDTGKYLKGDGTWSTVDALPSVTSSDNNKVLTVVSGAWAAATPASGLPSAPSSDGEYYLKCTVSSGVATYSWVTIPAANGVSF